MRREAARTLHSLSRAYQRGIDDLDYEVIVVENGSAPDQQLGEEFVRSFGPEFRYLDLGDDAHAVTGRRAQRGHRARPAASALALMIDGAHVLTPGVLRYGMAGPATYEPAIVATQQWYVGPGQQPDAMLDGLRPGLRGPTVRRRSSGRSTATACSTSATSSATATGSTACGRATASSCPASLLEQSGGVRRELLDAGRRLREPRALRAARRRRPTSSGDDPRRGLVPPGPRRHDHQPARPRRAARASSRLRRPLRRAPRARRFRGHGKPLHYVGTMRPNSIAHAVPTAHRRALRSRRRTAPDPDGLPAKPVPMPEELKTDFVDAFWHSLAWTQPTWLGRQSPRRRPTSSCTRSSSSAATRLDHRDRNRHRRAGAVPRVDLRPPRPRPGRLDRPEGRRPVARAPAHHLRRRHGPRPRAPLNGSAPCRRRPARARRARQPEDSRQRVREFELYAPLVPVGSYVIVEDTIVNGHPVWPGFGPGPMEAVKRIVNATALRVGSRPREVRPHVQPRRLPEAHALTIEDRPCGVRWFQDRCCVRSMASRAESARCPSAASGTRPK